MSRALWGKERPMYKIGIDVGGTFTDFVVTKESESPRYFKTPADPSAGVMTGSRQVADAFALGLKDLLAATDLIIHGTTVATNTLVERRGARAGLITTEGFRDLLEMREGLKEDRYNLRMTPVEPLVPRYLRAGIRERRYLYLVDAILIRNSIFPSKYARMRY